MGVKNHRTKWGKIIQPDIFWLNQSPSKISQKISQNPPKISEKTPKIHQKSLKNLPKSKNRPKNPPKNLPKSTEKSPTKTPKIASAWVWKLRHSTSASGGATVAAQASAKRSWARKNTCFHREKWCLKQQKWWVLRCFTLCSHILPNHFWEGFKHDNLPQRPEDSCRNWDSSTWGNGGSHRRFIPKLTRNGLHKQQKTASTTISARDVWLRIRSHCQTLIIETFTGTHVFPHGFLQMVPFGPCITPKMNPRTRLSVPTNWLWLSRTLLLCVKHFHVVPVCRWKFRGMLFETLR